jgi:WD40 repeat protein
MSSADITTQQTIPDGASFYVVGGTLATDAPSYVTREADRQLREALWRGDFCYVLDTRQVGKSSLMVRTAQFLKQQGVAVGILDLTRLGQSLNPDQWYYGLLLNLGGQTGCRDELRAFWQQNKELGPLQRFMEALRHVALPAAVAPDASEPKPGAQAFRHSGVQENTPAELYSPAPEHPNTRTPNTQHLNARTPERPSPNGRSHLVIFIDEIDNVLNLPFPTDEFFAAIRECYTRRAHDPEMRGLTFCLLGSTTPDNLIRDVRTTPFNIGARIEPTDFTLAEAAPLAAGIAETGRDGALLLQRVLHWTAGHPYLTQRLCRAVAEDGAVRTAADLDRLCAQLFFTKAAREGESNLTFVSNRILKSGVDLAGLLDMLGAVLANRPVKNDPADPLCATLRLSGMVRVVDGMLKVRNRIYATVFDLAWIRANMPDAEWRRQRAAYRRGQMRAAFVSGLAAVALASLLLTLWAVQRADTSRQHEHETDVANAKLKKALESGQVALKEAQQEREKADEAARKADRAAKQFNAERLVADRQRRLALARSIEATHASLLAQQNLKLAKKNENLALAYAGKATVANGKLAVLLKKNERFVYPTRIQAADRALLAGDLQTATDHLRQCVPSSFQADLRGFEWRYLMEQCRDLSFQTIQAHPAGVTAVAYGPGASLIASIGRDGGASQDGGPPREGRLTLWDAATGRQITSLRSPAFRGFRINFSPDGQRMASLDGNGVLLIVDVVTMTLDRTIMVGGAERGGIATFAPDGRTIATGDGGGNLQLWNANTGQHLLSPDRQNGAITDLVYSPDGKWLGAILRGPNEPICKLFDAHTGHEVAAMGRRQEIGPFNPMSVCLAFSADSKLVALGVNHQLFFWQTADGKLRARVNTSQSEITALAFAPDDGLLVTGGSDKMIRLWDPTPLRGSRPNLYSIATLGGHGGPIRTLAFTPDGKTLASGGQDGIIKQWSVQAIAAAHYRAGEDTPKMALFSPDGRLMARVGSGHLESRQVADPTVRIYDVSTQQRRVTLRDQNATGFIAAAFSPDSRLIAVSEDNGTVRLWDARTGETAGALQGVQEQVLTLAFSPDGKTLATGGMGGRDGITVRLWNLATEQQIGRLGDYFGPINALAFSPDGRLLVTGDGAGELRWWNMDSLQEIAGPIYGPPSPRRGRRPMRAHPGGILALTFAPNGKWLATGGVDSRVRVWRVATREPIVTQAHPDQVLALAYSPDGNTLASGSRDGTVKLWVPNSDLETPVQDAVTHLTDEYSVESLAFSPDGKTMVSAHYDGGLLFWRTVEPPPPAPVTPARPTL